ncbi:MAG: type II secretion system F family protein [Lachnospiraceae bacterium]
MLSEQTENKRLAKGIKAVKAEIEKGETLSDAMRGQGKTFPTMLIQMVQAGEATGSLDIAFSRMATQFEKEAKLKGLIKKASVYPVMVGLVAFIVVIVMLVKIIPSYSDMFQQMGTELPGITQMVLNASNFIITKWYLLLLFLAVVIVGIKTYQKTESGQRVFGKMAIVMPIFGKLNVKTAASLFARTSGTLLAAGIPMLEVLEIVGNTMKNKLYKEALMQAREEVSKGIPLSEPLKRCGIFPPMVCHMTKIGEETGDIEGMLSKLADYYDEEVEMATQTVMSALEPIIILVLAVLVIILIAAIMAPMLAMYQGMDNL